MLHKEPILQGKALPSMYLTITGGGTGIIPRLLEQGGASSYFIGAHIPYNTSGTDDIFKYLCSIGTIKSIPKYVSKEAAQALSYFGVSSAAILNIGVTASLMKSEGERPDRINEAYVCFNLSGVLTEYHWIFDKTVEVENLYRNPPRWNESVTRENQERALVNKLYAALVEMLAKEPNA